MTLEEFLKALALATDRPLKITGGPGDRLRLQLDTRRLHLFDPASGEAIL